MFNGQLAISNENPLRHRSYANRFLFPLVIDHCSLIIGHFALMFTPLESPAVCSGDEDYSFFSEHGV